MNENSIGQRIMLIINEKNLTVRSFSNTISCAHTTISNVINGKSEPGFKILSTILNKYPDISCKWLMLNEGEMRNENNSTSIQEIVSLKEDLNDAKKLAMNLSEVLKNLTNK